MASRLPVRCAVAARWVVGVEQGFFAGAVGLPLAEGPLGRSYGQAARPRRMIFGRGAEVSVPSEQLDRENAEHRREPGEGGQRGKRWEVAASARRDGSDRCAEWGVIANDAEDMRHPRAGQPEPGEERDGEEQQAAGGVGDVAPRMPKISPGATWKETSSTATVSP